MLEDYKTEFHSYFGDNYEECFSKSLFIITKGDRHSDKVILSAIDQNCMELLRRRDLVKVAMLLRMRECNLIVNYALMSSRDLFWLFERS